MKSKYSPELVDCLISAIEATGSDSDACKIAGISRETLYQYIKKFPDFADKREAARAFWKQHCPDRLKREAIQQFERLLTGQAEAVSVQVEEWTHADGSTSSKETRKTTKINPPRWAIERVLGVNKILTDQEIQGFGDLQVVEQALKALLSAETDVHSLPAATAGLVRLLEYRRKVSPPSVAEMAEQVLDFGYTPAELVQALKEKWLSRASLSSPPGAENN